MWKFLFSIQQEITMFPCCLLSKELISILQYMKVSNTVVPSQDNRICFLFVRRFLIHTKPILVMTGFQNMSRTALF